MRVCFWLLLLFVAFMAFADSLLFATFIAAAIIIDMLALRASVGFCWLRIGFVLVVSSSVV